jgi:hypothetical protein
MKLVHIITFTLFFLISSKAVGQCNAMMERYDEFENKQTYMSSIYNNVALYRIIKNSKSVYYLRLKTKGSTLEYGGKGVVCILADGTRFNKAQEDIDVDYEDGSYLYSAFITVTPAEIARLIKSPIKKFRLYIYDYTVSEKQQQEDAETMQCIMTK